MGWKERDFYLGPHGPLLFDTNGNAGTTAWWDGRIVGCWVQDPDGVVVLNLLEDVGSEARAALDAEAARLTAWLDGHRVSTVYPVDCHEAARSTRNLARCVSSPSNKPHPSSGSGSATPSAAGSASPATVTSAGPSSGRSSAPGCRWPTRPASTRTRGSRTPAPRRPGPPARRSTSRSGSPRSSTRRPSARSSRRRCPTGSTSSRSSMSPAGGSLADLLEASHWLIDLEVGRRGRRRPRSTRSWPPRRCSVERMTKKGLREFDCRGRRRLARRRRRTTPATRLDLVLRHAVPAVRPDDVLARLDRGRRPRAERMRRCSPASLQGPLDEVTGEIGDPLHARDDDESRSRRVRYSPWLTPAEVRDNPTTFSPGPPWPGTAGGTFVARPRRGRLVGDSDQPTSPTRARASDRGR